MKPNPTVHKKPKSMATLTWTVLNEFNNLLMSVLGNVSLIIGNMDPSEPHYKRLKNIEKQVQGGARLTSHLLEYAGIEEHEVKSVDFNQLVKETSDTFGRANKQVRIHRELAEDLFGIQADRAQIERMLSDLYVNATYAMPGGGDLILKSMNVTHEDMKRKCYNPKPGKYVSLTVTDTGTGMNKKTMERIFDPFFTTKEMGRGTGLGLASVYGIIKAHGGYIDVDSKRGQGTTFTLHLPGSEKEIQKGVNAAELFIKGSGTVLLVDDEQGIREVGQELLEAMGYRVLTAGSGEEAVELYRKSQDKIDIVLLNMVMPNMGGGEAHDRMKEINPHIRVILTSGYSINGEASEILKRGCDHFIQKPFKMKELSEKLREILDRE